MNLEPSGTKRARRAGLGPRLGGIAGVYLGRFGNRPAGRGANCAARPKQDRLVRNYKKNYIKNGTRMG